MSNNFQQRQPAAQRVAAAMNKANEPMNCKACGSIYFIELRAQMYTGGNYGFRSVSTSPQTVYQCICGELQIPQNINSGNPSGGERDLFAQSVAAANAFKKSQGPNALAQNVASVSELQAVVEKVNELSHQVNVLASGEGFELEDDDEPGFEPAEELQHVATGAPAEIETEKVETEIPKAAPQSEKPQAGKGGARERMKRQGSK